MSRIAPDIPELQQVPEVLRSIAYTRAMNRAIRAPLSWLLGAALFAVCIGIGATQGRAFFGTMGAVLGTAAGAAVAFLCFFRVILPWRARQLLPSLTNEGELKAFEQVRLADERLKRMAAAYEAHERGDRTQKSPRDPSRLP